MMAEEVKESVVRDLYKWTAPSRKVLKPDKEIYSTIIAVAILASIIFFFIKEFLLIVVVWALVFFYYALSQMESEMVEHKVTTQGLVSYGKSWLWTELGPFWFEGEGRDRVLKIASRRDWLGQMVLLLNGADEKKLTEILAKYLPFIETPEKTFSDKAVTWLTSKFSFEKAVKKEV
jgi:hypothetical protein